MLYKKTLITRLRHLYYCCYVIFLIAYNPHTSSGDSVPDWIMWHVIFAVETFIPFVLLGALIAFISYMCYGVIQTILNSTNEDIKEGIFLWGGLLIYGATIVWFFFNMNNLEFLTPTPVIPVAIILLGPVTLYGVIVYNRKKIINYIKIKLNKLISK